MKRFVFLPPLLLALMFLLGFLSEARAEEISVSETELKSAFLYNFAKFVIWPSEAFSSEEAPIRVAVLGDEKFAAVLGNKLRGKTAHGRGFVVQMIASPDEVEGCQMLFVPNDEIRRFPQIAELTKKLSVLTIGESPQFLELGGVINMVSSEGQLRFEINLEAAEKANLILSSQLLRLAQKIKKGGEK